MKSTINVIDLTLELVGIPSVNPDLDGGTGELAMMKRVREILEGIGLTPELQHVDGERANVLGVLPGNAPGTLIFEAHLDTVPMPTTPCPPRIDQGRIWGRGACDTKASVASMLAALELLAADDRSRPTIAFAGVVDEEYLMRGADALAGRFSDVLGVVIGEPTSLRPVRAHNGCVRFEVAVHGVTAHSSKAFLGTNAVVRAARIVLALEERIGNKLLLRSQGLTGPGLLTATEIAGGTAPNVVPDSCVVTFDRRLTPSETPGAALAEVDEVLSELQTRHGIEATRRTPWLALPAVEMPADHALVGIAESSSASVLGVSAAASGVPYCTDANVLTGQRYLPSVVIGPGSIDQAHAPVEWVDVEEVRQAVSVYTAMARASAGWAPLQEQVGQ